MCYLVTNKLLRLLSGAEFFTRAYVDDVIIVIVVDNQEIADDLMRFALSVVEKCCRDFNLIERYLPPWGRTPSGG